MKLKLISVVAILFATSLVFAGAGKEAILTGVSDNGKVHLNIRIWDVEDAVSKAELVMGKDTVDFVNDCDVFKIVEIQNHVLSLYFQQKGTNADTLEAKVLKVWALPNGFECAPGGSYQCKFRVKIEAFYPGHYHQNNVQAKLNCTFEWNP